jgi:hypothetical protein
VFTWYYCNASTLTNTNVAGYSDRDVSNGRYSGTNNLIGGAPLLSPLADNGGPTKSMAFVPGSPAIDDATTTGAPMDLRRSVRDGAVDIKAFERQTHTLSQSPVHRFSTRRGQVHRRISICDTANANLKVTLGVSHCTLTQGQTAGLMVNSAGTGTVTLTGTTADLNADLATLVYRGSLNDRGGDTFTVTANDGILRARSAIVVIHVASAVHRVAALQEYVRAFKPRVI